MFLGFRLYALSTKDDTQVSYDKFKVDLNYIDEYLPNDEYGFEIAFGIGSPILP